jgi:hypothetical protein
MLSEEVKVIGIIESIKDGRLTLDQYFFGFHADGDSDHCLRLRALCNALRSGSTNPIPESSFLIGHPQRPLSLDELCDGDFHEGSIQRRSIVSLRAELSSQPADRSSCLLRLADALSRRFSQWAQKEDLEEAIWSYKEALSLIPNSHYQYLETLLGLCSSLYQRFCLLGHAHDLQNLLRYLELEYNVLDRCPSLLAPVEARLKKLCQDSGSSEDPESNGTSDDFAILNSTDSDCDSAEEMKRREDEARRREEANRAAQEAQRALEEMRRKEEALRRQEEAARRREELARQQAEEDKRAAQEAQRRETEARDRKAESKRQEEEATKAACKSKELKFTIRMILCFILSIFSLHGDVILAGALPPTLALRMSLSREIDPNRFTQRSKWNIIWSCFATLFACSWIATHPNIPSKSDNFIRRFFRRLMTMTHMLVIPEAVIYWAARQWWAAWNIAKKHEGVLFAFGIS